MSFLIGSRIDSGIRNIQGVFKYSKYHIVLLWRTLLFKDLSRYLVDNNKDFKKLLSFWFVNILLIYSIAHVFNFVSSTYPFKLVMVIDIPFAKEFLKYLPTILTRHLIGLYFLCYILRLGFTKKEFKNNKEKLVGVFLLSSSFILVIYIIKLAVYLMFYNEFISSMQYIYAYMLDLSINKYSQEHSNFSFFYSCIPFILVVLLYISLHVLWFVFLVIKIAKLNIIQQKLKIGIKLFKALIIFFSVGFLLILAVENMKIWTLSLPSRIIYFNKIEKVLMKKNPNYQLASSLASAIANDKYAPEILRFHAIVKTQLFRTATSMHRNLEFRKILKKYLQISLRWEHNSHDKDGNDHHKLMLELKEFLEKQITEKNYYNILNDKTYKYIIEEIAIAEKIYLKNEGFKDIHWNEDMIGGNMNYGPRIMINSIPDDMRTRRALLNIQKEKSGESYIMHYCRLQIDFKNSFFSVFESVRQTSIYEKVILERAEQIKQQFIEDSFK